MSRRVLTGAVALALAACAPLPPVMGDSAGLAECRAHFLELDRMTDVDGIRDGGSHRIPGFPYLRSNRFLASFRDGLNSTRFEAWVERLRQRGLASRHSELSNLGSEDVDGELQQLDRCGAAWARRDLADPARRLELVRNVAVPDDYSMLKRALGMYPVSAPLMNLGAHLLRGRLVEDFRTPLAELPSPGPLLRWQPPASGSTTPAEIAGWLARAEPDALGIPQLDDWHWRRMAASYAPTWWVETGGDYDRPGQPGWMQGQATVDTAQPVTYFMPSYTRLGGRVLPQLVYTLWFPRRPAQGWMDSYAGELDGLVWRVTLDLDGTPLLYDSIHPCGCYYQVFPVKPLKARPQDALWSEGVLMPQAEVPAQAVALRVQSATHYLRRVVEPGQATGEAHAYELRDYRELLSLAAGEQRRSLFCRDGLVCGTQRGERYWLWMSGIDSPGAMRQAGRQPVAFVGRRHFDDADLFERLFVSP